MRIHMHRQVYINTYKIIFSLVDNNSMPADFLSAVSYVHISKGYGWMLRSRVSDSSRTVANVEGACLDAALT